MNHLIHDYTDRLLRCISEEYNIPYDMMINKYLTHQCDAMTSRGKKCTNKCVIGSKYCKKHEGYTPPPEKKKGRRPTKILKSKTVPIHTHDIEGDACELCRSHGDIMDPNTSRRIFKIELTEEMNEYIKTY